MLLLPKKPFGSEVIQKNIRITCWRRLRRRQCGFSLSGPCHGRSRRSATKQYVGHRCILLAWVLGLASCVPRVNAVLANRGYTYGYGFLVFCRCCSRRLYRSNLFLPRSASFRKATSQPKAHQDLPVRERPESRAEHRGRGRIDAPPWEKSL